MAENYSDLIECVEDQREEFKIKSRLTIEGYDSIISSLVKGEVTFSVRINSLLAVHQNVKREEQGKLEVVLTHANKEFNRVNKENDNQRDYIVSIHKGEAIVVVPEVLYWNYIPEKNRPLR